jgi:hypothetical protein
MIDLAGQRISAGAVIFHAEAIGIIAAARASGTPAGADIYRVKIRHPVRAVIEDSSAAGNGTAIYTIRGNFPVPATLAKTAAGDTCRFR